MTTQIEMLRKKKNVRNFRHSDKIMKERESQVGGGTEWEINERDILIEGAIIGLGENLVLGKFSGIHKYNPR